MTPKKLLAVQNKTVGWEGGREERKEGEWCLIINKACYIFNKVNRMEESSEQAFSEHYTPKLL